MNLQGFLAVDGSILEVEVWGLGGSSAKESQTSFKMREQLFTEQRRRVITASPFCKVPRVLW